MHPGRGRHPKIVDLLGRPEGALVRELLTAARTVGVAPTIFAGARVQTLTYVYDDPDHPDRPTTAIQSPAWTPEDQALLLALAQFETSLCQCGQPKTTAWHSEMDGWFEAESFVCHSCTARNDGKQVTYTVTRATRPTDKGPLPPFALGITTTRPDKT